jgi:hypothetical protein
VKKMPCIFLRDFANPDRSAPVTRTPHPECGWVFAGEGIATRKWDGTACMVRNGLLFARYDAKAGKTPPPGAIPCEPEPDPVTKHWPHWVRVEDQPQFKWIAEARENLRPLPLDDGTYEACGPKIGANPEGFPAHVLVRHGIHLHPEAPREFHALKAYLAPLHVEGLVFRHPDGRMAKIRRADFGLPWGARR